MRDTRFNPIDPSRENGRMYTNHSKYLDPDMIMLQSALLRKNNAKRLNIMPLILVVSGLALLFFIL